jgi:hypothetical protein
MWVNSDIFEVENWCSKSFTLSCVLVNKEEKFRCRVCTVYGAACDERKQEFLDELHECLSYNI